MSKTCSVVLLASLCCSNAHGQAPEKYALLIGVTKYEHARMNETQLEFPEADAEAVGRLLSESGYDVDVLKGKQATKAGVQKALQQARRRGNTDGVVFIGLFGHGVQYRDDAWFAPWDTNVRPVTDAQGRAILDANGLEQQEPDPDTMVPMKEILNTLNACGAGNRVFIADCCREDPNAARGRAFGSNLRISQLRRGTAVLFSCSENEKAYEHPDWQHGAFTRAFIDECRRLATRGRVRVADLTSPVHDRVKAMVRERARKQQTVNPITNGIVDLGLSRRRIAGETRSDNALKKELCWCPPGEFVFRSAGVRAYHTADSSQGPYESERSKTTRVRLTRGFWLAADEVSWEEFLAVLPGLRPAVAEDIPSTDDLSRYSARVSWQQATEFCRELTRRERKAGRLDQSESYVLPTVAQWQYALRANCATQYFFGNDVRQAGQFVAVPSDPLSPEIGTRLPNKWGLRDLVGASSEWCFDLAPDKDWPAGEDPVVSYDQRLIVKETGDLRLVAGSLWQDLDPDEINGVHFEGATEDSPWFGFRVALVRKR